MYRWWDGKSWTGNVSAASGVPGPAFALGAKAEFVGGMNVPSSLGGRLNATVPLARLVIDETTLQLQSRWFGKLMFGDFEVPLNEITAAFPLKSSFMAAGVGFQLSDGEVAYFWTLSNQQRVLAVLQQRGVPVDPAPRPARGSFSGQLGMLWRTGRGSPSSVAKVPGISRPMSALFPLFAVVAVVVIVLFASTGHPFGWFLAALGTLGLARSFVIWRRSRKT
jgi:hypothetical protein